jgi:apolipoprotein N-acyltransferase
VNWLLALVSAALLILCFPSYNLFWLAPVALAPLMIAAGRERRKWRRFLLGYASGIVYWFAVCNWIESTIATHGGMSAMAAWFCFALFCLAKALQTGVFTLLAGYTLRTRLAIPATAALWVLVEYTHAPMGFTWLNLGNAAIDMGFTLRLAPIAGVWGISFLFAATAAESANLALRRPGMPLLGVALIPLLFLLPALPRQQAPQETANLVQPNIDEAEDFTPQSFARLLARMRELSLNQPSRLLIWPEAPAPFYDNDPAFMQYLSNLARTGQTYFLSGLVGHWPNGGNLNSAVLLNPQGEIVSSYAKMNLVPFGEYVPWPLGPIAFKISTEAGDFQPGVRQVVSPIGGHCMATFICYESVFPKFIAGFVRGGAELLVNPSNDGWFGKTAARYQHLEIVRMRAAENRRWILRATNDGITAAIDPAGGVRQKLELYRETSGLMGFSYQREMTLYTRWGDWFVGVCLLLWAGAMVAFQISGKAKGPDRSGPLAFK